MRARSRCARNSCPSPTPSDAPSISPGTSATTSCRPSGDSTVPSTGCSVVNGYSATFGRAFEMRVRSDDLPAFGKPTSAASASSLRCSSMSSSSPGRPDLREARHLPRRRDEARVAASALAALREHDPRISMREIGDQVAVVGEDLRADRDAELDVAAVRAVLARAASVLPAPGLDQPAPPQGREIAQRRVGDQDDVAAAAAVAAVRPALGHVLLAAEATVAVAALAGLDANPGPVVEHWRQGWLAPVTRYAAAGGGRSPVGHLIDRHEAPLAARAERDRAGPHREDRVVAADLRCRGPGGTSCRAGGR